MTEVHQWDLFELQLSGPSDGNPFLDTRLSATFEQAGASITVPGFYDGEGIYRIRFMPPQTGPWTYRTSSNHTELNEQSGSFTCASPRPGIHGPVEVDPPCHFRYADGTPYQPFGTTCYAWTHQTAEREEETLTTLAASPFNKVRMCVFPKHYVYNRNQPPRMPFARGQFNPAFFQHLEKQIQNLGRLGIEADLILFHPYDKWGFSRMKRESDLAYLRYLVARLAAFRNVWWSLANEFDLLMNKTPAEWDRLFQCIEAEDPYGHLRSIHNHHHPFDHAKPWVTHVSLQSCDLAEGMKLRERFQKPVLFDECRYEGNIKEGWGNLSPQEMVQAHWLALVCGCYAGHGECYRHPENVLWWSKGDKLYGQSPRRIAFLKAIAGELPLSAMVPERCSEHLFANAGKTHRLVYCTRPGPFELALPDDYAVDLIDPGKCISVPWVRGRAGSFASMPSPHLSPCGA